jgi:hypothetical protein
MPLKSKRSPAEGEFLFEIDERPTEECLTALGGVPLFVRTARSLDVPGSVKRNLTLKQRDRGFDEATYIESFLVLNAAGGDCLEDFDCLREDRGLAAMLGHAVPSPEAARKFLYQFHDPEKIEQAQRDLPVGEVSYVPEDSMALRGLAQVNQDVVRELARRCAGERIATIDMDATVIESWKREAKATYEGGSGYQPMVALWAELNVVVAEEFRDGNVPALKDPLRVAQRGFAALPETIKERYFRGDSACDEEELLSWLRDEKRANGPAGFIGFAVSARVNPVFAGRDRRHSRGKVAALQRRQRSGEGMRAGGVLSGRDGGESLPGAVADHRHSDSQKAGGTVWRRQRSEAFRGTNEPVGLETEAAVGLAPREGGHD